MGGGIIDVVDEILSHDPKAAGLAVNWQIFGSNGQEKADYSRGVLERFTRRAESDWTPNVHVKTIANPRLIKWCGHPHFSRYFEGLYAVNENGTIVPEFANKPVTVDKIAVNHYYTKSKEEWAKKSSGIRADTATLRTQRLDRNDEFDDGILKYRDARAKIYQPPKPRSAEDLIKALDRNLSPTLSEDTPQDFYADKMETFLTCRAVAAYLGEKTYEETAVKAIIKVLANSPSEVDKQMFDADEQLKQRKDLIAARNTPPKSEEIQPMFNGYQTHIAGKGWCKYVSENQISNDIEQKRDIQAIKINFPGYKVYYQVYYNAKEGWSEEIESPNMAGTTGKSKAIYGVRIRLDEAGTKKSDILYRVHKFDGEWTDWAKNGEVIYSYGQKLNAIQIKLETKRT